VIAFSGCCVLSAGSMEESKKLEHCRSKEQSWSESCHNVPFNCCSIFILSLLAQCGGKLKVKRKEASRLVVVKTASANVRGR
jgi:hypothetical protein